MRRINGYLTSSRGTTPDGPRTGNPKRRGFRLIESAGATDPAMMAPARHRKMAVLTLTSEQAGPRNPPPQARERDTACCVAGMSANTGAIFSLSRAGGVRVGVSQRNANAEVRLASVTPTSLYVASAAVSSAYGRFDARLSCRMPARAAQFLRQFLLDQEVTMVNRMQFYIDGKWVDPVTPKTIDVINPANEEAFARISLGSKADVDKAVAAARKAFETFSKTTREERLALLGKIIAVYQKRYRARSRRPISKEMGAPLRGFEHAQAATGMGHLAEAMKILKDYKFEEVRGTTAIVREPVGVCGMITPWNWPINQIACKVAPALAAGCTMVLKPSEVAPMNAMLFADVMHEAGVPPGVFNLVNGDGPTVGEAMSAHPGHRHDVVHRLDARRHRGRQGRRRYGQARGAGTGRQVGQHRPRRRRPDQGGERRRDAHVHQFGPVLQRADPHVRAARQERSGHRHRQGDGREGQGRRSAAPKGTTIGPVVPRPSTTRSRRSSRRASTRAPRWSPAASAVRKA